MKKLFFALLFIFIAFCSFPVFSQEIDVTLMSYDDLNDLKEKIDYEWRSRPENGYFTLEIGEYVAGKDIPVGNYFGYNGDLNNRYSKIEIDNENGRYIMSAVLQINVSPEKILSINENNIITIENGPVILSKLALEPKELYEREKPVEDGVTVPVGVYLVGKEIPEGSYSLYYSDEYGYTNIICFPNYDIYTETLADTSNKSLANYVQFISKFNDGFHIDLIEGNVVRFTAPAIMKKSTNNFSFE